MNIPITRHAGEEIEVYGKTVRIDNVGYPWNLLEMHGDLDQFISDNAEIDDSTEIYTENGPVYIEKDAELTDSRIEGPAWIGKKGEIGPKSVVRGGSIGRNCHVGASTEIKNSIIMNNSNVPHLSYVGDSVIGRNANLGAGTNIANLRHDGRNVSAVIEDEEIETERRKLGAIIGDHVKTGIDTSIYPGTVIGPFSVTFPGTVVKSEVKPFTVVTENGSRRMDIGRCQEIFSEVKNLKKVWKKCVE